MSVFGDLDMAKVSDNPFKIDDDTYLCACTDIKVYAPKVEGEPSSVKFSWKIDEPGNKFNGLSLSKYYSLFVKPIREYTDDEDKVADYEKAASFLKMLLRNGFDLSEEEIAELDSWSDLIGSEMYVKVVNTKGTGQHEGRTFSNVNAITSKRRHEERLGKSSESLGL